LFCSPGFCVVGKEQNAPTRKQNCKENRDIKGIWGNAKRRINQSEIGDQKKNRNIKGIWGK
jgi:hypothetical protein